MNGRMTKATIAPRMIKVIRVILFSGMGFTWVERAEVSAENLQEHVLEGEKSRPKIRVH